MKKSIVPIVILGLLSFVTAKQPTWTPGHGVLSENGDRGHGGGRNGLRAKAELTGSQEVPPNASEAEGSFDIRFDCDYTEARFELDVEADRVLQAHLHCGAAGTNGPVVVFLFGMFPGGVDVDGTLSAFTLTQANLDAVNASCTNAIGYEIDTLEGLALAIADGDIYVNVHTVAIASGEIRGQLQLTRQSRCATPGGDNHDNANEIGSDRNH